MKPDSKKDSFHAKLAFGLSLGFWVPLFNIGFLIASIVFAVIALKRNRQDPAHFDGRGWAAAALVLSVTGILGIVVFFVTQWPVLFG